jgi:cytoskeletal protein RodZ
MDGKYLKCGIKNVGSEEIFTNVAKVHVASSRMEMFLKKNNTTLYIAIALVLLVILIIVFVYFNFIKGKEKDPFKKHWDKVKAKEEEKEAAKQKAAEEALQKQEEERKKNVVVYEVKSMQPTMEEYNQSVNEVQQVQEPVAPMVQQPEHPVVQQPVQQSSLNTIDLFSHVGTEQNNQDSNGTE